MRLSGNGKWIMLLYKSPGEAHLGQETDGLGAKDNFRWQEAEFGLSGWFEVDRGFGLRGVLKGGLWASTH